VLARGTQWMSLRAGYVKSMGDYQPDGLMGGGFGYRRFVLDHWSFGGFANYELLGRFGRAADIQVPITLEVARHSRWGAAVYPYVGVGAGAFFQKVYRTGVDRSGMVPGRYVTMGAYTPVQKNAMLGLDIRLAQVERTDNNPAFLGPWAERPKVDDLLGYLKQGPVIYYDNDESKMHTIWSFKLDYTLTF
jgi:hypothetical protein